LGLDIFGRGVNIVTCMLPWQREKNRRAGRLTLREKERDWEKGSGIEGYRERGKATHRRLGGSTHERAQWPLDWGRGDRRTVGKCPVGLSQCIT